MMDKYVNAEQRGMDDYVNGIRFPSQCPYNRKRLCDAWGAGQVKARMCELDEQKPAHVPSTGGEA